MGSRGLSFATRRPQSPNRVMNRPGDFNAALLLPLQLAMPSSGKRRRRAPQSVSILSNNRETLDALRTYFEQAGVRAHCALSVNDLAGVAHSAATAAVIFPDDFAAGEILTLLRELRRSRPRLLALLVTREPQRFGSALDADGESLPPLVLPKPSFGWEILDAIRAYETSSEGSNA